MKAIAFWSVVGALLIACGPDTDGPTVGEQQHEMKRLIPILELHKMPGTFEPAAHEPAAAPAGPEEAPDEPDDEGIDGVRETGFEPGPEDEQGEPGDECIDCVRETGFVPAPVLQLLEHEVDVAHLRWTADEEVTRFEVVAVPFGSNGQPEVPVAYSVEGYRAFELPLDGRRTVVTVVATDPAGKAISKQSNAIDLPAR